MTEQPSSDKLGEYAHLIQGPGTVGVFISHFQKRMTAFQKRHPPNTFGGKLAKDLVDHSLGFDAIEAIFARVIERNPILGDLFIKVAERYDTKTLESMWLITRKIAIEMLDEENPEHIARSTLASEILCRR